MDTVRTSHKKYEQSITYIHTGCYSTTQQSNKVIYLCLAVIVQNTSNQLSKASCHQKQWETNKMPSVIRLESEFIALLTSDT